MTCVQIRILGPLEASVDDEPVALGGAKQRAVLAMLGLEANRTVSADRLIEGLWGEEPPVSAAETLEIYAFMEAADESKRQGGVPITIESVMTKATAATASN